MFPARMCVCVWGGHLTPAEALDPCCWCGVPTSRPMAACLLPAHDACLRAARRQKHEMTLTCLPARIHLRDAVIDLPAGRCVGCARI